MCYAHEVLTHSCWAREAGGYIACIRLAYILWTRSADTLSGARAADTPLRHEVLWARGVNTLLSAQGAGAMQAVRTKCWRYVKGTRRWRFAVSTRC